MMMMQWNNGLLGDYHHHDHHCVCICMPILYQLTFLPLPCLACCSSCHHDHHHQHMAWSSERVESAVSFHFPFIPHQLSLSSTTSLTTIFFSKKMSIKRIFSLFQQNLEKSKKYILLTMRVNSINDL